MALQKEIWISDIESNLYANNAFLGVIGKDDSAYVDNKTVHVPQAGAKPTVVIDRASLPATISQRTDADLNYNLKEFTTDPILIQDTEAVQVSYNKRQDVLSDHIKQLSSSVANHSLYTWAASGSSRIVRTSGASTTLLAPSATGNRKAITLQDVQDARTILGQDDINQDEEMYLIMPAQIYWSQFVGIDKISKFLEFGANTAVLPTGVINRILGINIVIRSSVVVYDNTGTPVIKATGSNGLPSSPAAADNMGCILTSKYAVRKAIGQTKVFDNMGDPTFYGDVFSALVLHGASKSRTNQEGIVSIVQAAA
jgi:hypothetical protein